MDDAHRGDTALAASDYQSAVSHYSKAIAASPNAAAYYIKRSTAYLRCSQHQAALNDADKAVVLATERARRELIAQAQLRRGMALFQLGRYVDADFVLAISQKLNDKDKSLGVWKAKAVSQLKAKSAADREKELTVKEVPDLDQSTTKSGENKMVEHNVKDETGDQKESPSNDVIPAAPPQRPADKIRHDWYQNDEKVFVTLMVKGIPEDQATVDLRERSLSISFPLVNGSVFDFSLDPLFAKIDVDSSKFAVTPTKTEFILQKARPGARWASLESSDGVNESHVDVSDIQLASTSTTPSYPTSSRHGPKDWDKIVQSYVRPSATTSGKDEDSENQKKANDDFIDDEFEEGDPVNGFFKKLYAGASDDTKRAMMKSYQESGGTSLSTNWDEVKQEKVKVSPPTGMEEKQWEY